MTVNLGLVLPFTLSKKNAITHPVNVQFMLTYFVVFCMGLLSILLCARMVKTYRFKYLSHYLYFLITINIGALYGDVPENFGSFLGNSPQVFKLGGILSALLGTPMILTAIYMFANLIAGLLDKRLGKTFKIVYFTLFGGFFMSFILLTAHYFETGEDKLLMTIMGYSLKVFIIMFFMILIYFFLNLKGLPDQNQRRELRIFGIFHNVNFCFVLCFTIQGCPIAHLSQNLFLLFFFILQLFPLLYLNRFLKQCRTEFLLPGPGEDMKDLDAIFSRHKISKREKEIIHLLVKGKSNKEIEDELFISIHTVRNHIYKIYQKLGIKNRVELVNFIRNSLN